jgi:NADPH:quinone reductase-like Zn-dependent oxidoreductase
MPVSTAPICYSASGSIRHRRTHHPYRDWKSQAKVVAVGERCSSLQVGDRVCALTHGGGYASHAIAREDHCLTLPDNLSTEQGAALPEALLTVWYNVMERGQLSAG